SVAAAPTPVALRFAKTDALLGVSIPAAEQGRLLASLGLMEEPQGRTEGSARFSVPTWRVDLKREADLIEEIARLHGVDRIPSTPPRAAIGARAFDAVYDEHAEARRLLTALGLQEAQGQTLIAEPASRLVAPAEGLLHLSNPLSHEMQVLRPSLLPGLLDALHHN